jgi:tRNA threonylcarbamoyladenosine biosynthesis protein TsaE
LIGSAEGTERLGEVLGRGFDAGPVVVALIGPLGAGKTTLVRGLARGLGIASRVKSPSFVLHDQHEGRLWLDHFDAYFVRDGEELVRNGLHEFLSAGHVAVIEWADRCLGELPDERIEIHLDHDPRGRRCRVVASGDRLATLWQAARRELEASGDLIAQATGAVLREDS